LALTVALTGRVNDRLEELLPAESREPVELHRAMRYSCLAPGKRLRPALCLMAANAAGGAVEDALDAACAIEMVHAFSLIHDDLPCIDDDDLRRGRPTCHIVFGEAIATLAGDALFALAFDTLARAGYAPERLVQALLELTTATGSDGLVGGEAMDVLAESGPPDPDVLRMIHERKTGSLIAASCAIGGALAGARKREVASLRRYGRSLGVAFQIVDDVLNLTSTPEELGKAAGSDQSRRKLTYPRIYGLEASRAEAERLTRDAIRELEGFGPEAEPLRALAREALGRTR
jgi:geranylgeranyl diphosphate synthase type II